jgi:hypothetical protein
MARQPFPVSALAKDDPLFPVYADLQEEQLCFYCRLRLTPWLTLSLQERCIADPAALHYFPKLPMCHGVALFPLSLVDRWNEPSVIERVRTRGTRDLLLGSLDEYGITEAAVTRYDAMVRVCRPFTDDDVDGPERDADYEALVMELGGPQAFAHLPSFTLHGGLTRAATEASRALRGFLPDDVLAIPMAVVTTRWDAQQPQPADEVAL